LRHGRGWQRQLALALAELPAGAALHLAIRRLAAQVDLRLRSGRPGIIAGGAACPGVPGLGFLSSGICPVMGWSFWSRLICGLCSLLPTAAWRILWPGSFAGPGRHWREPLGGPSPPTALRPCGGNGLVARRLRGLASRHYRMAHLGGWEHLVAWQDSPGLWRDLADLQPMRMLLDEVDRLPDI